MKTANNRWFSSLTIGIISASAIALCFHFSLLETLEFKTLDHRFHHMPRWRPETSDQRSEVGDQRTEAGEQTSEVRDQRPEDSVALAAPGQISGAGLPSAQTASSSERDILPASHAVDAKREGGSPANISIIVIDQASIEYAYKTMDQRWPWPREFYAKILGFLHTAGAKAVVFDMFFSEPDIDRMDISGADSDAALVAATHYVTNVFHTYVLQQTGLPPEPDEQAAIIKASKLPTRGQVKGNTHCVISNKFNLKNYRTGALPSAALTHASSGIGFATVIAERDNICRRIQLVASFTNNILMCQSLAAGYKLLHEPQIYLTEKTFKIGSQTVAIDNTGSAFLWWYRPQEGYQSPYPHHSAFNILRAAVRLEQGLPPEVQLSDFRDKIIYIGSTAPGLFDNWATPLAGGTPGVEVQATALANLLRNDYVSRLPSTLIHIAIFVLCLITALATGSGLRHHTKGMIIPPTLLIATISAGYILLATHHIFIDVVPLSMGIMLTFGITTIKNYLTERRHSKMVRGIFEHYLDRNVVNNLISNPDQVRLGGEVRKCTVLFTDVANFTNTSEQLGPEQVVKFMNIYLNAMTDIIIEEGGFVDKFIGDEIIAIFGAPNILPDHAERACRATLRMRDKVKELQPEFREAGCKTEIFARTGMCTGDVVIGNMGSDTRMNYTAMGNTMNLGARIEGINKIYGTRIMVNETTAKESGHLFREIDTVQVKGKDKGEHIFELIGTKGDTNQEFHKALTLFRNRKWEEAKAIFSKLADAGDPPSQLFVKRCTTYTETPPPDDWNGIYVMQTK